MFSSNGLYLVLAILFFCIGYRRRKQKGKSKLFAWFRKSKEVKYTAEELEVLFNKREAEKYKAQAEFINAERKLRKSGVSVDEESD